MNEEEIRGFIEVGKLAGRIREESKKLIMIGEALIDIAETIEQMIYENGAQPAFPVNISINNIAAHYTPEKDSEQCLGENDLVKIDMGVALNGALSDNAYSIDLSGKNQGIIETAENALNEAVKAIKPGTINGEIGAIIERHIESKGFRPITNLTGHMIKTNNLHAGISLPNIKTGERYEFKAGDVFAVEPFVTNGRDYVEDSEEVEIFSLIAPKSVRMRESRRILQYITEKFGPLPFAKRWLMKEFTSNVLLSAAIREMLSAQILHAYPVLKGSEGSLIAQAEHTVLVEDDGARILTA